MLSTALSGDYQDMEIEALMNLSISVNQNKEKEITNHFSEEEKEIMVKEYLGDTNTSYYSQNKRQYLQNPSAFLKIGSYKKNKNQSFIFSAIVSSLKKTIGLKGIDLILGNSGREEILCVAEDAFLRTLNTYIVPKNLREELKKAQEDSNYTIKKSSLNQFNSYLRTTIHRDITNTVKTPGKYEKDQTIIEKYIVSKGSEKKTVEKTRKIKGEYIPDPSRSLPISLKLQDDGPNNHDEIGNSNDNKWIMEINLDEDRIFGTNSNSSKDVDEKLTDAYTRKILVDIYNSFDEKEKIMLLNNSEFCEVFGLKRLTQEELAENMSVSQGTISRLCADANFKLAAKLLRAGYSFEERMFL